jgi:hypothetical protein
LQRLGDLLHNLITLADYLHLVAATWGLLFLEVLFTLWCLSRLS